MLKRSGRFSDKIFPGARFSRLTVIERIPKGKGKRAKVRCRCDCGNIVEPDCSNLTNGNSKSCGCLNHEKIQARAEEKSKNALGYGKVIPGTVFGRLTVIQRIERTSKVECHCQCGTVKLIGIDGLISGGTKSCGCLSRELTIKRNKENAKHDGFSAKYPRTFISWSSMLSRCYNPMQTSYNDYGSKGVTVCQALREDPYTLVRLIGPRKKSILSLDRFPIHDGHYTCGQCEECQQNGWKLNIRWTTRKGQSLNRGDFNVYLTAFGKTMTRSQWEELSGIGAECVRKRLNRGWTIEKSLTTPDKHGNCYCP
ncbi:MAG: hypothetical protein KGL39_12575 [Patescibacteria group bacterium]|nr:hypothetical protein [Patescibacteria group bacterium]